MYAPTDPEVSVTEVTTVFKDGVGYDSAKLIATVRGMWESTDLVVHRRGLLEQDTLIARYMRAIAGLV